jgi:superfamily I DNA/RNA helicase
MSIATAERLPTFILCRTNAPLVKCAFDLIKLGRNIRIKMIGKEIAKQLKDLVGEVLEYRRKSPMDEFKILLDGWIANIRAEFQEKEGGEEIIAEANDKYECLVVIGQHCVDTDGLLKNIDQFFIDGDTEDDPNTIYLCSGHRSKGLERERVIILRPDLCPHPGAKLPADIEQEEYLWYVMLTRAMKCLIICRDDRP